MKKFILKILSLWVAALMSMLVVIAATVYWIPPQFQGLAPSVIQRKYQHLLETTSPKVIVTGGSSGAFGVNSNLLEDALQRPVCNMAMSAGMGIQFGSNIVKANIQQGDLVILAFEYAHWYDDQLQPEMLVPGIDGAPQLYQYAARDDYGKLLRYFPTYFFRKLGGWLESPIEVEGINSASSYNAIGQMIYDRPQCVLPSPLRSEQRNVRLDASSINSDVVRFVNQFYREMKTRQVSVAVSFAPVLDEAVVSDAQEIAAFESALAEKLDCPVISKAQDTIFSREYMFDTVYHCNNRGMDKRTRLLAEDISRIL